MLENPYNYGSQIYVPVTSPSGLQGAQFPWYFQPGPSTSVVNNNGDESAAVEGDQAKGRKGKKQAAKYDSFQAGEERFLVNLWVSYHERLESKDSRKYWSKIVEELNAKFHNNRTVEKCKRKMKYLVDRYKERKDWNRKQSGGSIWKSQHYDEIDAVLGVRDVAVTFEHVAEAGSASTSGSESQGSPESVCSTLSTGNASNQSSASIEKESRRQRKKKEGFT